jgi:large subunit ribosomal protein L33
MKDKKTHPERMETKKFCRFCNAHTPHRETK